MPPYEGPVMRLVASGTLWLVVAAPLLGALWQAVVARRMIERARGSTGHARELARARQAALVFVGLAAAATLAHALMLSGVAGPGEHALFERVARGVRVGVLDVGIDLVLEPTSAVVCALTCGAALAAAARLAGSWRVWACLELALAGALAAVLADGFATLALAWALGGAAAASVAAWGGERPAVIAGTRAVGAIGALLLGAAILFWGLGGGWQGADYAPDLGPRFVAASVARSDTQDTPGAWLTMTSVPGARLFLDDARVPLEAGRHAVRSPFARVPVTPGIHGLRIHPGDGADDTVVDRVTFGEGEELALVPLGPTLSFREIAAQLALRDERGERPARRELASRTAPLGFGVPTAALGVLLLAAWAIAAPFGPTEAPAGSRTRRGSVPPAQAPPAAAPPMLAAFVQCVASPALGVVLLVRMTPVAPLASQSWLVAGVAVAVLAAAWRARVGWSGAWLADAPATVGRLVTSMERWVVGAATSAVEGLAWAAAWVAARADEHVVGAPGDAAAAGVTRAADMLEAATGVSTRVVAWTIVGAALTLALLHAAWPG
jgi:hypothetical protein